MDNKVRLVQVIGGGEFGGAERYVLNLVCGLDKDIFEPIVACGYEGRLSRTLREEGVPVHVLPSGTGGLSALSGLLRTVRPQIVHTHGVRGNLFGRLAARRTGVPALVTTVHSDMALDYPALLKRTAYMLLDRLTDPMVTRYVVVSEAMKSVVVRRGIGTGRITVVPNGVDTTAFHPSPGAAAWLHDQVGVGPQVRLVGMAARLHPVKGHDLFLRAAAELAATSRTLDIRFLVVGSGPPEYREHLQAQTERLGLRGRVLFLGEREDVPAILAGLDAAVVPSRFEAFSLSVIEAMASGAPLVATRVGAIPEIVEDGVTGLLSHPGDALDLAAKILTVLVDRDLARRLTENGLQAADRYSIDKFIRRMGELYLELLKGQA